MIPIRVLVVDDHPFFRSGVVQWIQQQDGLMCCGQAESLANAREAVATSHPDVILLDLHLKDGDGLGYLSELAQTAPRVRPLVLSQAAEEVFAHRALRAGARGYLMKSEATESLLLAIQCVVRGEIYVSRKVSARLLHNLFPDPAATGPELCRLSDRELQVFQLLGAGCGNREIAATLKISPKTVETYREHLKGKLGVSDSEGLIRAARRWVDLGEFKIEQPEEAV